jgi:hypothetical protein
MSDPAAASSAYHLKYDATEDRLLVSVDLAPAQEYAMSLTRRLTKQLLAALAGHHAKNAAAGLRNPAARDSVLNFAHGQAVAEGIAGGEVRADAGGRIAVAAPKPVREIRIALNAQGETAVGLDDGQRTLTIALSAPRTHLFIAALLDIATKAAWDLPPIATWLDAATPATAMPRVLH